MRVELPDGRIIEDVPDGTTKEQLAQKLKANGMEVPSEWLAPPKRQTPMEMIKERANQFTERVFKGPAEGAASLLSGAIAVPAAGAASIAGAVMPGPPGQAEKWRDATQEALTYQPRTETGKRVADVISYPGQKLSELAETAGKKTMEATGSPTLATGVDVALNAIPTVLGGALKAPAARGLARAEAEAAKKTSQNAPKNEAWNAAREEGYVVPPSKVGGGGVSNRLEGFAGKAAISQEAAKRNQEVTNTIARREASLTDDQPQMLFREANTLARREVDLTDAQPLTTENLANARERLAAPYRKAGELSPNIKMDWERVRKARLEAARLFKQYNSSEVKDLQVLAKAKRKRDAAAKFEDRIEVEAAKLGEPTLVDELRTARMRLAKNFDVERALNTSTGEVDARVLGRMYEKDKGKRMTGGLATVGKFANQFPLESRRGSTVPSPGIGRLEATEAIALGAAGLHGGVGLLPAVIPFLSHPIRLALLKKSGNMSRDYQPGMGVRLSEMATRNPYAFGITQDLGLRRPDDQ